MMRSQSGRTGGANKLCLGIPSILSRLHLFCITLESAWCHDTRTATVEKDWTRTRCQLRMTAVFCPIYFNDCTALLGLITMEPVIRSRHLFLIHDQGHILSNYI
jgi:hypothetical protein